MPRASEPDLPYPAAALRAAGADRAREWRIEPVDGTGEPNGRVRLAAFDPGAKPFSEGSKAEDQARVPNSVFLPKPFSLNDLTNTVQGLLS